MESSKNQLSTKTSATEYLVGQIENVILNFRKTIADLSSTKKSKF